MQYLNIKAFLQPASFPSMYLNIHLPRRERGLQAQEIGQDLTAHPHPPTCVSPLPPSQIQAATSAMMRPLSARGPAELSRPAPRKCQRGPGSCSGGAQPPSPLQTRPCSTTSLRGLQQQPSPISRVVGDIKAQGQRQQLASDRLVVCKYHHTDIYFKNAAGGGKAGSAPPLSKRLQQRETPGAVPVTASRSRAPCARLSQTLG